MLMSPTPLLAGACVTQVHDTRLNILRRPSLSNKMQSHVRKDFDPLDSPFSSFGTQMERPEGQQLSYDLEVKSQGRNSKC